VRVLVIGCIANAWAKRMIWGLLESAIQNDLHYWFCLCAPAFVIELFYLCRFESMHE